MCESLIVQRQKVLFHLNKPSSVKIPDIVREIGDGACSSLSSLIDLSFEEEIVKIGTAAFDGCFTLENLAFPASLIVIDAKAFRECNHLRKITFAARDRCFMDCSNMESVWFEW
jgi:hypothetical protein